MTTVFISGSREIPYLPEEARTRIDRIMDQGFEVVVGDSERGVDARAIEYLSACGYQRVSVYTVHERPRAKGVLGSWDIRHVTPATKAKMGADGRVRNARELETAKDEAMGGSADYGLVIWKSSFTNRFGRESASKGSLRNMYQLVTSGKPVVLYKYEENDGAEPEFRCFELRRAEDLAGMVDRCPDVVRRAYATMTKRNKNSDSRQEKLFCP